MIGIIESLSAFKTQVRHMMKQIINLTHSEQNEALDFLQMHLKRAMFSFENSNTKSLRQNQIQFKCNARKNLLYLHKSTKYRSVSKNSKTECKCGIKRKKKHVRIKLSSFENKVDSVSVINKKNGNAEAYNTRTEDCEEIDVHDESFEPRNKIKIELSEYSENMIHNKDAIKKETNSNLIDSNKELKKPSESSVTDKPTKLIKQEIDNSKKFVCRICNMPLEKYILLIEHLFNHDISPRSCYKCRNTFLNAIPFKLHLNTDCSQYYSASVDVIFDHFVKITENMENKIGDITLICPYCGIRFAKHFNLKRHLLRSCGKPQVLTSPEKSLNQVFECLECPMFFTSSKDYAKHQKKHIKGMKRCSRCDCSFPTRKLFRAHNNIHPKVKADMFKCHQCDITFPNRLSYRKHIKVFKNDALHEQGVQSTRIWCKICKKSFYDQYTYERHCSRINHLEVALPNTDFSDNKPIICEKCGVTFLSKSGLRTHITKLHSNKEHIKCEKCDYTSNSKSNMLRHERSVHEGGYKRYACDKCPAMFNAASAVKEHINSVHSELRQFSCDICSKAFKLKSHLTRHKTIHVSIMPFSCKQCAMGFKRRAHLVRHTKSKHKEHVPKEHVMELENANIVQKIQKENKLTMTQSVVTSDMQNLHEDRVFSLIDAQSGELVTLSATELSKSAVINMSDGALLNEVHMPELWNHPTTTIYSLDPLQDTVIPQTEYNIITHDRPEMAHVLQKTLQNQIPKDEMHFCIPQGREEMRHSTMEHTTIAVGSQPLELKGVIPQFMCVCVYENSGTQ